MFIPNLNPTHIALTFVFVFLLHYVYYSFPLFFLAFKTASADVMKARRIGSYLFCSATTSFHADLRRCIYAVLIDIRTSTKPNPWYIPLTTTPVKVGKKGHFKVSQSKATSPRRRDGEYVIPAPAPAAFTFGSSSGGFDFSAPAPAASPTESTVPTPTSTTPQPINNSAPLALASSNNEALPSPTLATKETFDAPTAVEEGTHPSHSEAASTACTEEWKPADSSSALSPFRDVRPMPLPPICGLIVEAPVESEVVDQLEVGRPKTVEDDKVASNSKGNDKLRGV